MIAYLDSSVILRLVLNQPNRWASWESVETGVASALVEVECLRTLDRVRLRAGFSDDALVERIEFLHALLGSLEIVELTRPVLARASQPFPTSLGTLDAIHLATALLWRDQSGMDITLVTHDGALSVAARASGLRVAGV